jgi:hypothetical protein
MNAALVVVIVIVILSLSVIAMVGTRWDRGIDEKQVKAEKDAIEQMDKAFKSGDDPNEPARWVP